MGAAPHLAGPNRQPLKISIQAMRATEDMESNHSLDRDNFYTTGCEVDNTGAGQPSEAAASV